MAVVIETTLGDITVDLYLDKRPATCLNFLKLCKMKYYNFNLFHSIRSGFIAQTGDPAGEGSGGDSIWGLLEGSEKRFFSGEKMPKIRHTQAGLLSMVCTGDMMVGSQFFLTLGADLDSLDGIHCVIGEVTEGHEVLRKLNEVICDETHRPYQDVRITHTVILEDPFNDPFGLSAPSRSPSPSVERLKGGRIAPDEELDEMHGKTVEEIQELIEEKEAKARATILEIVGDLPDADIAPPENVLFVCKLNPVTTDEDLEIIFSRFGNIVSCEVIRDKKSGDSLQYAFIEFSDKKSCEDAYFKMDNVLIDDRRIHVDFSQSVSKIKWLGKGRGVKHINDESPEHDIKSASSNRKHDDSRNNHYRDKYKQQDRDSNRDRDRYNKIEKEERSHRSHRERSRSKTRHDSSQNKSSRYERHNRNSEINKKDDSNKINISRHNRHKLKSRKQESLSTSNDRQEKSPIESKNSHERTRRKMESSPKRDRSQRSPRNKVKLSPSRDKYSYSEKPAHQREQKVNNINYPGNTEREYKNNKSKMEYTQNSKRKHVTESYIGSKKSRYEDENLKALTPSPIIEKHQQKNGSEVKKQKEKKAKKTKTLKKRRKPSTSSSDSSSSDTSTSTSSDTSSSSGRDRKKSSKRKRKKYSSSSSSSDSSSTSSSDTDSDTSSSSDSDRKKRNKHKKNIKKKNVKKTRKRS